MEITIRIPNPTTLRRFWKWGLLPLFALALMLTWGHEGGGPAEAQDGGGAGTGGPASTTSPDFSLVVSGGGVVKDSCDSGFDDKKCMVHPGEEFTVIVYLDDIGTLSSYDFLRFNVGYSQNLTLKNRTSTTEIVWPSCLYGGETKKTQHYSAACLSGSPSTWYGLDAAVLELDFNCPDFKSKETVTLIHGDGLNTSVASGSGVYPEFPFPSGQAAAETIVINCDNYFPWDTTGPSGVPDGVVDLMYDVMDVADHFDEQKGTP